MPPTLPEKLLKKLYVTMLRIRLCEESLIEPILNKQIRCPVHLCSGQEAVSAGVCAALKKTDYIFGNHRSHGHFLAKGGSMKELVAEVYCKETGCSRGRGGSMHLIDPECGMMGSAPIVAGTISLALGAAMGSWIRNDGRVTATFFGDGAAGEGVLHESINFAALKKLPLIFVCENNLYSTHLPIMEIRPNGKIYEMARPFINNTFRTDGNDAQKVYGLAMKAVEICRGGQGPVFIELLTYRMHGHVGPDDNIHGAHTDIRPKDEIDGWRGRDPIMRLERRLMKKGVLSVNNVKRIRESVAEEVAEAHACALASDYPMKEELMRYVFKG